MNSGLPVMIILLSLAEIATAHADVRADVEKLVPEASAMKQEDFEKLAGDRAAPTEKAVRDKSLTLMLLAANASVASEAQRQEFKYLGDKPLKPSEIAKEIYRPAFRIGQRTILKSPVTFLSADRITNVTAEVDGDEATGTVTFIAPKLYEGLVQYAAVRDSGGWRITEWRMPAYGIHLTRDGGGLWQKK